MNDKDILSKLLKLNNEIFIKTRDFIDKQYPGMKDEDKILPIAILTNRMRSDIFGVGFHSMLSKTQQEQATQMMQQGLKQLGLGG